MSESILNGELDVFYMDYLSKVESSLKIQWSFSLYFLFWNFFRLCPQYVMGPQLQSTCHYIVNHYVKILHVHLGAANNMRPLSWGAQTEKIPFLKSIFQTHSQNPSFWLQVFPFGFTGSGIVWRMVSLLKPNWS